MIRVIQKINKLKKIWLIKKKIVILHSQRRRIPYMGDKVATYMTP